MPVDNEWNYKQIPQFYDRVRALLDNLSSASLPDKYIDMPEKAPFSERYAKSKVPQWSVLSEQDHAIFESAIVYKTASLFESLVSANSVKKKELPTITLEYFARSEILVNDLSLDAVADNLLNELIGEEESPYIGFLVTQ